MKRKIISIILIAAAVMLSCTACSAQADGTDTDGQKTALDSAENESPEAASDTSDSPSEKNDGTPPAGESASEQNADSKPQSWQVTLDWQDTENHDTAEDGTLLYTGTCTYPIVSIEGNQAAADNINASIREQVNAFNADTSIQDFAREDYVPENTGFIGYSNDLSFAARRYDSNVISFEVTYYSYSGGAHGNYTCIGLNYSTQTGEPIAFAELGEDADSFRAATFAYNRALADTEPYQNRMYGIPSDDDLESVLYAEDKWFLSSDGLIFISDPYALGPYAAGSIDFTIPYGELETMGLKEEYRYNGNLTLQLQDALPALMDLNGDGKEETILFNTVYDGSSDTVNEFTAHLFINDIDVVNETNQELYSLLSDFPWAQCVLYDLDPSDDTIEIAFITTEYSAEDDTPSFTSSFFRYAKDGSITYLGKTASRLPDPEFEPSLIAP